MAVQNGQENVIEYLINHGADVEKATADGHTPLHLAASLGRLKATKFVLCHGANVGREDKDGFFKELSQGAKVNKGDKYRMTALHLAAQNGHLNVTTYLLIQGAEVNKGDNVGATALHRNAQNGRLDITEYLISQGAKVNEGDINDLKDIHLAIQLAIQHGHTSIIEKLVSEGADLNIQSTDGQTSLHKAIKLCNKSEEIIQGTDTLKDISDEYYKGELSPEKALVFYLLENGAKLDVKDKAGNLPIQYAKDEEIKQMILSR
ncbi:serine/threonine-protein phosphatase 6 regulatory ankyrin repeat subunit B-like [Strongylocentrotus purpuratus]|uniref:Uncharacterized protein n=1 Tax=Strongylocentrotus purpuratus TaxID=7668 RepID=A0A7M7NZL9_STRPU|nr:serine/threonine-protein phosphatase 6 regulatory ankyrin repeat subunit B-like [Strongylocentrotus purpuratus]